MDSHVVTAFLLRITCVAECHSFAEAQTTSSISEETERRRGNFNSDAKLRRIDCKPFIARIVVVSPSYLLILFRHPEAGSRYIFISLAILLMSHFSGE